MTTIFLHIHKTGGTTLSHALRWGTGFARRHWTDPGDTNADSYRSLSSAERAEIGLLQGHFLYGVHEAVPGKSAYVSMLRDPVERIISAYYYTIETFPDTYIRDMGLEAFGAGESIHREKNSQARRIAGLTPEEAEKMSGDELFERAAQHAKEKFACLGVLERYDESLVLMRHALDWPLYPLYLREKSTARPRGEEISSSTRKTLADINAVDVRFYRWARERLDKQMASHAPVVEQDLQRFRKLNSLYQQVAPPIVSLYRRFRS
jgi:hypothetical protein